MLKSKIITIVFSGLVLFSFSGCRDWLDVRPESETILEEYWKTESQAEAVLMSCYRYFTEPSNMEKMIVWGEVRSDNLTQGNGTSGPLSKVIEVDITSSNQFCQWGSMYTVINYCNTFMHFAPQVLDYDQTFTEGKLKTMEAEVLTLRSLAYFYLVRAFRDIPWITEPSIDDTQNYNVYQTTERAVLDSIISDLLYAEKFAPENYDTEEMSKVRITKNAVKALLADVYLWDEQYDKVVQKCDEILQDPTLEFVDAEDFLYNVFYVGTSKESIFEFSFDDDEISNDIVRSYYGFLGVNYGQLSMPLFLTDVNGEHSIFHHKVSSSLIESDEDEDIRYKDFINQNQAVNGYNYIFKYAGLQRSETNEGNSSYTYASKSPNWIVYRLADITLMKAEALVQLNRGEADLQGAMDMVNETYLRANPELSGDSLQLADYNSQDEMEKLVLRERQRELMFEGKRWYDLMRLARRDGDPVRLLNYVVYKFTGDQALQYSKMSVMDALYFPISQSEINANPNLQQNPFYEITGSSSTTE
ncbi:RagB/SusD family nutrient uptake outer membrane protein [Saccharicrinis sp. FJH54]|uniref:RagB/SusD family nutrient uptake outer membrane protein n=1 Tax=Saccharicrinis sp. FJH54 TaxID=3344665 RepID=UPI0035D48B06